MKGHEAATSTPITRVDGDSAFTAMPIPLISPPPPTGTTTASSDGSSSSSSSAMVPAPAMTSGWEYGEMYSPPPPAAKRLRLALGLVVVAALAQLGAGGADRVHLGARGASAAMKTVSGRFERPRGEGEGAAVVAGGRRHERAAAPRRRPARGRAARR